MTLTRSGVAVAASGLVLLVAGWFADYPELVVLAFGGIAALVVAAGWALLGRAALPAQREIHPERVGVGQLAHSVVTVENRSRRRSPPVIAVEAVQGREQHLAIPSLGHGQRHTVRYRLPSDRRGVYQVGPLTIGHSDPFRLMWSGAEAASQRALYVHPKIYTVEPVPTGRAHDMDGPTSSSAPQGGVAFHSLRDYVHGDDWRLIHWKSTARLGTLIVRHNVVPDESRLMIVLDTSAGPYSERSFEHAVSAAASLCMAAVHGGIPLELRTTGGEVATVARGPANAPGVTHLLDRLAEVQRGDDEGLSVLPRMVPSDAGVALGVVTGQPAPGDLAAVVAVRPRFLMTSLVQFTDGARVGPAAPSGVVSLAAATGEEFAVAWNHLVRR